MPIYSLAVDYASRMVRTCVWREFPRDDRAPSRKQKAPTLNRRPLLPRARRNQLFACVNEVDAIALVLKAKGEAELLPSAILAISLARRQWREREVAHATDIRETYKCLCARRREGVDVALVTT